MKQDIPSKLYHGTTESVARGALQDGLLPRTSRKSNWKIESSPFHVYLSVAYAPYFAASAAEETSDKWGIVEIDTSKLNLEYMRPDEDFLEQCSRTEMDSNKGITIEERTAWYRSHLNEYRHLWMRSLETLGNCSYNGHILPEAVMRVAIFDRKSNPYIYMMAVDPCVTPLNFQFMHAKYEALTRWFFEPVSALELAEPFWSVLPEEHRKAQAEAAKDRSGLEVLWRAPKG